jgi:DNA helicase TIP49 (TBP-interacting protein)
MISVQFVKQANKLETHLEEEMVATATPTDVYNKLLINSRMLSNLNTNKIKPSDVLEIVNKSCEIAIVLKESLLKNNAPLNTDKIDQVHYSNKKPQDVFYNLVSLFDLVTQYAADNFTKELLSLETVKINRKIEPSDVFDLANLLLAELSYLAHSNSLTIPNDSAFMYEEEITPSIVFNRVNDIHTILAD